MRVLVLLAVLLAACAPGAATASATPRPAYCVDARPEDLQEITGTPAGPYFVHHPAALTARAPTVVFLPGGSGLKRNAQRAWDTILGARDLLDGEGGLHPDEVVRRHLADENDDGR